MKTILKILAITLFLSTISCDQNDDTPTPVNKFTAAGIDYVTTNCYVEFDEDLPKDEFNLFFINGRMFDNDGSSGDYLFSANTTNFVFYNIRSTENPSIITPFYPNIQTNIPYIGGESDTVVIVNGDPNDDTQGTNLSNASTPTITINSWVFNNTTNTGTINVDYTWGPVTGHYEGTIGVFED